jgi:hypothetical protein
VKSLIWGKFYELDQGCQPAAPKLFCDPTSDWEIQAIFPQDIFRIFPLFQPGASNLRPRQNSNKKFWDREFPPFALRFWLEITLFYWTQNPKNPEKTKKKRWFSRIQSTE